jgi:DNA-binding LacI/PurR family transcriptional regulator
MGITSREERYQGYIRTLLDNRIPVNVRSIFLKCPPFSRTELPGELRTYLAENPDVTAIACSDDYVAAALMYTAMELGIAVPDRLSIAGFSDIQMAALLPVPLTTVRQSTDHLGRSAVKLLMRRIRQSRESVLTVRLNTAIIRRQSVKRLSSGELPAGKPQADERPIGKTSFDGRRADEPLVVETAGRQTVSR